MTNDSEQKILNQISAILNRMDEEKQANTREQIAKHFKELNNDKKIEEASNKDQTRKIRVNHTGCKKAVPKTFINTKITDLVKQNNSEVSVQSSHDGNSSSWVSLAIKKSSINSKLCSSSSSHKPPPNLSGSSCVDNVNLFSCLACSCLTAVPAGDSKQLESSTLPRKAAAAKSERTFIMVKPDGVQRGLVGEIIKRFEVRGFKLVALKFQQASDEQLTKTYSKLVGRPFYQGLINYMQTGPVVPMVWEGASVVKTSRAMLGESNSADSKPGCIRGDHCIQMGLNTNHPGRNIIHGSDTVASAKREIAIWFKPEELTKYKLAK